MRLNTSIFLWVFPATVLPLAVLALAATAWSENRYLEGVDRELFLNLNSVAASLERRLLVERDILSGLKSVPPVEQFEAVLDDLNQGRVHPRYLLRLEQLNRFLETFQSVRSSLDIVRVLGREGQTLVKVQSGKRNLPVFAGFGELPYVVSVQKRWVTLVARVFNANAGIQGIVG